MIYESVKAKKIKMSIMSFIKRCANINTIVMIFFITVFPLGKLCAESDQSSVELTAGDRILILAPHPDDEVIGCGGIIQKAKALNLPMRIVFFTYGDSNQWSFMVYRKHPVVMPKAVRKMGLLRHDEAVRAAETFGITAENLTFLGYPDFRTLEIWNSHWGNRSPAKGMLTEARKVPYPNALRPGALYKGEEVLRDLKTILRQFKPTKIFLSHPADHNPDHQALYLFTRVLLWDLESEMQPELYPYLVHVSNWPLPRGYHPDRLIDPPDLFKNLCEWKFYDLNNEDLKKKYEALKEHKSQFESSEKYLLTFIRSNEMFGDPPIVKFVEEFSPFSIDKENARQLPEELTEEEKAVFVGVKERTIRSENSDILIKIKLLRPLAKTVRLSLYLFGYRSDLSFSSMPKLHIKFEETKYQIFDQKKIIPNKKIKVKQTLKEICIYVPLDLLGNPRYVLTTAHTYIGDVPMDWSSWRIIELSSR